MLLRYACISLVIKVKSHKGKILKGRAVVKML